MMDFYYKAQPFIAPGLANSQLAYMDTLEAHVNKGSRWLDLGCGHQIVPSWIPLSEEREGALSARAKVIVGIDYDQRSLLEHKRIKYKVRGDLEKLPFKDGSFDLVTANMVIEHVKDPGILLLEIGRILQPGGKFIMHTPNLLNYATFFAFLVPRPIKVKLIEYLERRKEDDIFQAYYRMNSLGRIRDIAKKTSLNIFQIDTVESSPSSVMLGTLVIIELLVIKFLRLPFLRNFKSNIIAIIQKRR